MSIETEDIKDLIDEKIKEHMDFQPYSCVCEECGATVALGVSIQNDYDMDITVPICECAIKKEE